MNRTALSATGLVLAAILFISVNVFSNNAFRSARLDLTEDRLFTLSEGSKRVIAAVEEPINLRLYFSAEQANRMPGIKSYGNRVRELLEEYVNVSGGKIRLELVDPEPFTDLEDQAVRAGLQAVPMNSGDSLYFGLVGTNTTDDEEKIPFFSRERESFLEYDLTRLVYNLTDPKRPVVGLITGHQMNAHVNKLMRLGGGPEPWAIVDVIREVYQLRIQSPNSDPIDEDVDMLLIVHPVGLTDKALYAIDQFVLKGGRAIVYVDPHSEIAASAMRDPRMQGRAPLPTASGLEKLLNAWGVSVDGEKFVGDFAIAQQVNVGVSGTPKIIRYLAWLQFGQGNYNPDDVITSNLGPVIMASAGQITKFEGAKTTLTPLIQSSDQAMLFGVEEVQAGPQPDRLIELFKADGKQHVLAARINGPALSAFPDGAPKEEKPDDKDKDAAAEKDKEAAAPHLVESKGDINVMVVADGDMLFDQFWVRKQQLLGQTVLVPISSNANMLVNALDNMAGSSDLIGLRSRGASEREFIVVENLRRAAEQQYLNQERDLLAKLEKTKERIAELESKASAGTGALLSAEQQQAIDDARAEILKTRRELRDVQHSLNKDIETLETQLKFVNIGLVPIAVAIIAVVLAMLRLNRRRAAVSTD
jgi:ABC-type uncharacterized transport system involved in gliding motility auxiliary subunit